MKFLCGSCKAKYQVADEKVAGRTVRMTCRKCGSEIVIKGEEAEGSRGSQRPGPGAAAADKSRSARPGTSPRPGDSSRSNPVPSARPAASGSASRRPQSSALGADFRRQVAAPAAEAPSRPSLVETMWHVAINDVPVGPIGRDEIGRKITTGAVKPESLCWREGFDDWRPVKDIPELAALLRSRAKPPLAPKGVPSARGPMPAAGGSRPRIRAVGPGTSSSARTASVTAPAARAAAHSNVVPIGGRIAAAPVVEPVEESLDDLVAEQEAAAAAPAADPFAAFVAPPASEASALATPSPEVSLQISGPPARRGMPVGAWIAIAGAGAFGMMLAAMIGTKMLAAPPPAVAAAPTATAPTGPAPIAEAVVPEEAPVEEAPTETMLPEEAVEGSATSMRPVTGRPANATKAPDNLTPEQRALLERFGGSSAGGPQLNLRGVGEDGPRRTGEGLNAAQLSRTVTANRPNLTRCYETATRGMGDVPNIRLDVAVTVGGSGTVTRVGVTGNDVNGLARCIESSVRRWRFEASGAETQTTFPLVFQPAR